MIDILNERIEEKEIGISKFRITESKFLKKNQIFTKPAIETLQALNVSSHFYSSDIKQSWHIDYFTTQKDSEYKNLFKIDDINFKLNNTFKVTDIPTSRQVSFASTEVIDFGRSLGSGTNNITVGSAVSNASLSVIGPSIGVTALSYDIKSGIATVKLDSGDIIDCKPVNVSEVGELTQVSIRPERVELNKSKLPKKAHTLTAEVLEFIYMGDAKLMKRPNWRSKTIKSEFLEYGYFRKNPAGIHKELWYHEQGDRSWLVVTRNTVTHEILKVELARNLKRKLNAK